jgi:hypothetical protein
MLVDPDRGQGPAATVQQDHGRIAGDAAGLGTDVLHAQGRQTVAHAGVAAVGRQFQLVRLARQGGGQDAAGGRGRQRGRADRGVDTRGRTAAPLQNGDADILIGAEAAEGRAFLTVAGRGPPFDADPA